MPKHKKHTDNNKHQDKANESSRLTSPQELASRYGSTLTENNHNSNPEPTELDSDANTVADNASPSNKSDVIINIHDDPALDLDLTTNSISSQSIEDTISAWNVVTSLASIVLSKENYTRLIAASVLTAISSALSYVAPYFLGETINSMMEKENALVAGYELTPEIMILILMTANTLSQILPNLRDQILAPVTAHSTQKLLTKTTDHQLKKNLDYHSRTLLGDQFYLYHKVFSASNSVTPILNKILPSIFSITMTVALLSARYGTGMGLGVMAGTLGVGGYSALTTKQIINAREAMLTTGRIAWEKISGAAIKQFKNIHDFGKFAHVMKIIEKVTHDAALTEISAITTPLKIGLGHIGIPRLGMLAAALYVNAGIKTNEYTPQDFILLMSFLESLSLQIPSIGQAVNDLFAAYPDLKFVFNELAKTDEIIDHFPEKPLDIKGRIRFEEVTFAYPNKPDGEPPLFDKLSFTIEAGETAAFVSQTGGGKSTIFKLLYGYNIPISGKIYIDEQDISQFSLKSLQANIGLVAQSPNLFNDTVRENIKFGSADPDNLSDDQIRELAKLANLDEFLDSLSGKLDTPVGEDGTQLSGGQQQRVAILRGLLKQTPIRLFDEITSALDSITAGKILQGIDKITENQTKLVITHKLTEAQFADKIFVLAKGAVIAHGTHSQLLETCPLYQTLWNEQNTNLDTAPKLNANSRVMSDDKQAHEIKTPALMELETKSVSSSVNIASRLAASSNTSPNKVAAAFCSSSSLPDMASTSTPTSTPFPDPAPDGTPAQSQTSIPRVK